MGKLLRVKPSDPRLGWFRGFNFMTPNVLGYYLVPGGIAELSQGRGMTGQPLFGVTVGEGPSWPRLSQRSKLFSDRREAERYIAEGANPDRCVPERS